MKTLHRIFPSLLTGLALSLHSARADDIKLTAKVPSMVGTPDATATSLMPYPIYSFAVHSMAFSPDGKTLATGDGYGNLRLWDTSKGDLRTTIEAHQGWVFSIAWLSDGKRLATGGKDRVIRIREAAPPWQVLKTFEGHTSDVHAIAFTVDGATLVSAGDDRTIRVWDVSSEQALRTLTGHEKQISAIALSPDGRLIASGSRDHSIRLWDVKTGKEAGIIGGHNGDVMSVKFSPDGNAARFGKLRSVRPTLGFQDAKGDQLSEWPHVPCLQRGLRAEWETTGFGGRPHCPALGPSERNEREDLRSPNRSRSRPAYRARRRFGRRLQSGWPDAGCGLDVGHGPPCFTGHRCGAAYAHTIAC